MVVLIRYYYRHANSKIKYLIHYNNELAETGKAGTGCDWTPAKPISVNNAEPTL